MAKYVILNFDETDRFRLTTERPELSLASSTFNPAKPGVFFLPEDSEAVFIQLIGLNPVKDLGHDAASALSRFTDAGGKVVCFIGPSDQAELGKLIGPFPELHFQPNSLPESIFFSPDEPYQSVFEQFQMSISHAYKLLPAAMAGDAWEGSPKLGRAASVLAKSSDGCPVALLLPHGRGSYVLLPWFGTNNIDVVSTLLSVPKKKSAPEPEIPPPPRPEPVDEEVPPIAAAPSLADVGSLIAGISKPVPEPEILPYLIHEPAPVETSDIAPAPSAAVVEPVIADVPGPAPGPEILAPRRPEPVHKEIPQIAAEPSFADLGAVIADLSKPVPEPETLPAVNYEPAPDQTPDIAPALSLADVGPVIPDVPRPAPEPEILAPPKREPGHEEIPQLTAMPSLAEVEPLMTDISRPVPEPVILPAMNHEPGPAETPDIAQAPFLADVGPVISEMPAPAPEPGILPAPKREPGHEEVPEPAPIPSPDVEPQPDQAPDKISVPSIPDLVAGREETAWLEQEEYAFPELKEIYANREEATQRYTQARQEIEQRHAQAMQEVEQGLQAFKASGQEAFLNLLRSEGQELVQAAIFVLKYLGWNRVIDVHDYWKKVIRAKEEEIWVLESESPSVEVGLMRDKLLLVLVRSGTAGATDDECALLQRYKGRRMQEYNNTQMKALLIGNYFMTTEGKSRTSPFSPQQVEDAQKDGNALLSTYDLFQAIKAEKEGRVTKDELRRELVEKSGLIHFAS